MWYFWSGSKTDTKNGVWRSTGEACEIYNTSLVIGFRKTLQFYEGPAHDGQKTNWMMQEFTTTEKFSSKMVCKFSFRLHPHVLDLITILLLSIFLNPTSYSIASLVG